jgi:hypothetical protein
MTIIQMLMLADMHRKDSPFAPWQQGFGDCITIMMDAVEIGTNIFEYEFVMAVKATATMYYDVAAFTNDNSVAMYHLGVANGYEMFGNALQGYGFCR